jgi:hypothetical protein
VLFDAISRDVCVNRPASVILRGDLANREVRHSAVMHGFRSASTEAGHGGYEKFCVGTVVTPGNWRECGELLGKMFGVSLPASPPAYSGLDTIIMIEGRNRVREGIKLQDFEARFGPVILMLADRPVTVVPIQRTYADQLLRSASQQSLFPAPEASVWQEKLYLSSPRTLSVLKPGTVILFYESIGNDSGRGAIIAAAQVVRTAVRETIAIVPGEIRRGVLSSEEIGTLSVSGRTALTFFNQLMRLDNPVGLSRLRALGCADGANFVTARRIEEAAALAIIQEGEPSVRLS